MELLQQECVSLPLSVDFNATTMVAADPTNSFLQNTAFSSAAADRHRETERQREQWSSLQAQFEFKNCDFVFCFFFYP
jgi:hypothetical protein